MRLTRRYWGSSLVSVTQACHWIQRPIGLPWPCGSPAGPGGPGWWRWRVGSAAGPWSVDTCSSGRWTWGAALPSWPTAPSGTPAGHDSDQSFQSPAERPGKMHWIMTRVKMLFLGFVSYGKHIFVWTSLTFALLNAPWSTTVQDIWKGWI